MAAVSDEIKQRITGILVAIGLLIVAFGFAWLLTRHGSDAVMPSNPVWFVGMLIIFGAALALIAVVFRWLGLANPAEAFGLPTGTVRAVLAVAVMVLFTVFGLASIAVDEKAPKKARESIGTAVSETKSVADEIKRYEAANILAVRESVSASGDVTTLHLYRLDQGRPAETVDLMKQIVTALVTLLTSVVSFYFGSRTVEGARAGRGDGAGNAPAESTLQDLQQIDKDLEDASTRWKALQSEHALAGNEAALEARRAQLAKDFEKAKADRAALEARRKDVSTGAATAEAMATETQTLKDAMRALMALVQQTEALVAKGVIDMPTTYEVTATALNLRSAPTTASTVLAVLRRGQTCTGNGAASGAWLPVLAGLDAGWVHGDFVRGTDGTGPVNPTAASPSPTSTSTPLPMPPSMDLPPAAGVVLPTDPQTRMRSMDPLHPLFRAAVQGLLKRAEEEGRPFRLFEAYRTPERQQWLFEQGRTRPGNIVTKARPWTSFHQFGLASDLVLFVNGQWTWSDAGPLADHWKRLPSLAKEFGLRTLSFEAPHVEWPVDIRDPLGPELMAAGDADWADTLASAADRWRRAGGTDAPDLKLPQRPALPVT